MGGEPSGREKPLAEGVAEEKVAGLLCLVGLDLRPVDVTADLLQGPADAFGIARKLHGGRVGQKLALPRDSRLDESPAEKSGEPDDQKCQPQGEERHPPFSSVSIPAPATTVEH